MKFRMFTDEMSDEKVAVNVDHVRMIEVFDTETKSTRIILTGNELIRDDAFPEAKDYQMNLIVKEDFDTVLARLNTIAE